MNIDEPAHQENQALATTGGGASAGAELEELEKLGERIAELSAQISAATYELLAMIRDFDERGGWGGGFRSCAHWLCWRVGLDPGAAREKVRVARALGALPLLAAAMRRGEISYSKVRALTRIATPAIEQSLLGFARAGTAAHVERLVRGMRLVDRIASGKDEKRRHATRYLHVYTDEDGMVTVRGRLTPEAGAALIRALDAGVEQLYGPWRHSQPAAAGQEGAEAAAKAEAAAAAVEAAEDFSAEQRRADALGLVAESALAAGLDPGTRGDRYQVVVHVDAEVLAPAARAVPPGSPTARTFPRKRPGGWPATRPGWRCGTPRMAGCSTSAAAPAPSRPPCAAPSSIATAAAASRAAA